MWTLSEPPQAPQLFSGREIARQIRQTGAHSPFAFWRCEYVRGCTSFYTSLLVFLRAFGIPAAAGRPVGFLGWPIIGRWPIMGTPPSYTNLSVVRAAIRSSLAKRHHGRAATQGGGHDNSGGITHKVPEDLQQEEHAGGSGWKPAYSWFSKL